MILKSRKKRNFPFEKYLFVFPDVRNQVRAEAAAEIDDLNEKLEECNKKEQEASKD